MYDIIAKKTGKTPKGAVNKPVFTPEDHWYINTFYTLNLSRQSGMSLGAIPISEITNYYNEFEMIDSKRCFLKVMQALDSVYLEHVNNQNKKSAS